MYGPTYIFWADLTPFSLKAAKASTSGGDTKNTKGKKAGAAQKAPKKMDQKARDNKTIQMLKDTVAKLKQDSVSTKLKQSLLENSELKKENAEARANGFIPQEKAGSKSAPKDPDQPLGSNKKKPKKGDQKVEPEPELELEPEPEPEPEHQPQPGAGAKASSTAESETTTADPEATPPTQP